MKKIFKLLSIAIIFSLIIAGSNQSFGQYSESVVTSNMGSMGWKLSNNRYAFLKEGVSTDWWSATFYSGTEYAVVAFSNDEDVEDMDVEVQYPGGGTYAKDKDTDDFAMVTFSPAVDRTLKIRMTNYASDTPDFASECHYLVFYR